MNKNWKSLTPVLKRILDDEIASGRECACQLCIRDHGETVIDLFSGRPDASSSETITADSLFPFFSTGKAVLAALAWRMVGKGKLRFDTRIAELWPAFDSPDKSGITLEHLLSHRAGLYLLPSGKPDLADWDGMCSQIAAMMPRNAPGEKTHYHPLTFGWLVGHTLELAAGKPLPELLRTEILAPCGIEKDMFFGIDEENAKRVVPIDDALLSGNSSWEAQTMNDPDIRRCCIPSFAGIGNARGLAKFYSLVRGGVVPSELFDYATGKLFRSPAETVKEESWTKFALGMVLIGPPENRRMFCGHGGAAGAEAFYMPEEEIAFAFVKNRLSPNHPVHSVRDRISEALAIPRRVW